ncbi:hypothetical protein, partial [Methylicorpusculum sp.]
MDSPLGNPPDRSDSADLRPDPSKQGAFILGLAYFPDQVILRPWRFAAAKPPYLLEQTRPYGGCRVDSPPGNPANRSDTTHPHPDFSKPGVFIFKAGLFSDKVILRPWRFAGAKPPYNWNKLGHMAAVGWIRRQAIHLNEATKPTHARTFPGKGFLFRGGLFSRLGDTSAM